MRILLAGGYRCHALSRSLAVVLSLGSTANINTFNGTSDGDLSDWLGLTPASFNHPLSRGQEEPFTAGGLTLMDVIVYDAAAIPEPGTLVLLATSLIALAALCRNLTQRTAYLKL